MSSQRYKYHRLCLWLLVALPTVFVPHLPANAQVLVPEGPVTGILRPQSPLGRALEQDMPGIANPASPYVWPPSFGAEIRVRPILIYSAQGTVSDPSGSFSLDLFQDLGFVERIFLVEGMARLQLSRFSLRGTYTAFVRNYSGSQGNLDWPEFRFGADLDLVQRKGLRVGVNIDGAPWANPKFSFTRPGIGSESIEGGRPVTAGVHIAWNPPGWGGLAPSLEARARWPLRDATKVTEYEVAGGIKSPATVLGTSALRGGWRHTHMDFSGHGREIEATWSGFFAEYMFLF
jgi:hypothetical protein